MTRYDVRTELHLGGQWVDISGDIYQRDGITIRRGRPNEGGKTDPGACSLTLDNRDATYSPRNPEGPHYGLLGRNTPLRVWIGKPSTGAAEFSDTGSTSHVAPSVNSRAEAALLFCGWVSLFPSGTNESYTVPASMTAVSEWGSGVGSDMATAFQQLTTSGDTGTRTATYTTAASYAAISVAIPGESGPPVIEETLNQAVNNASSSQDITLTTASSTQAGWWILAMQAWNFDSQSTMPPEPQGTPGEWLPMGNAGAGSTSHPHVRAWVRRVDEAGEQTVTFKGEPDDTGYANYGWVWVLSGVNFHTPRFVGEVAAFPPRWEPSESDVTTPIEAAGILRRLGQAASPLRSPIYRAVTNVHPLDPQPVAYWPMEDGEDSVSLASAVEGGTPMTIVRNPELAAFTGFAASEAIPELGTGLFVGRVGDYPSSSSWQVQFLLAVPSGGVSADTRLVEVRTTGTARRFEVEVDAGGALRTFVYSETGAVLDDTGNFTFDLNGKLVRFSLEARQNGSDVDYGFATVQPGADTGLVVSRTVTNATVGQVADVALGARTGEDLGDTAIGHLSIRDAIISIFEFGDETNAFRGEAAGRRIERLCREENITFTAEGDLDATAALGPQSVDTLLALLREAADADGGILAERRADLGLHYTSHAALYNRAPIVTLDCTNGEVSPPLEPIEDDRALANDVTVKRRGGSSARAIRSSGPLSTQPPPDGVGLYDASYTLSLHSDEQTRQQAAWRLHLGTIDQLRYPVVTVNLNGRTDLHPGVRRIEPGDRFGITNLPAFLPPGDAELTCEGVSERLNAYSWVVEFNTSPAESHLVAEFNSSTYGRLGTDGSELAEALTTSETGVDVTITAGPLWTTDAGDLPFDVEVGGERMTVTAVSGSSSPQTFTVTRSVNGITKTHAAGAAVELARPARLALGQTGQNQSNFDSLLP